ncbi:MAG TPA: LysE family translocator [Pyrinomonadaceae bacterium]|jgi:threonine/homoserine/homoserine lactone efflux protein
MPESSHLYLFVAAALVLLLTPGPAVLYVIARSVNQGRVAGVVSVLGLEVGTLFHVGAAALGLSALLLSSALAFSVVKYLGAAYLIYLGIRKLLAREEVRQEEAGRRESLKRVFCEGVVVNVLNPKTALFFFAFLPQFISPARGNVTGQMLFLGCLFVVLATLSDGVYALLAGSVGHWLKGSRRFLKGERYFAGTVYIGLGVTTALSGARNK